MIKATYKFGCTNDEMHNIRWEDDSGLFIIAEREHLPSEAGMWRFILMENNKNILNTWWYSDRWPTLYDVYRSTRLTLKILDGARAGSAPHFEHSLYAAEVQLAAYYRDKIKDILLEMKQNV